MQITNQDFAFYFLLNLNDIGFAVQRATSTLVKLVLIL
jgi:hypothetical protein